MRLAAYLSAEISNSSISFGTAAENEDFPV